MSDIDWPRLRSWVDAYADRLGVAAPTDEQIEVLLELAGSAAHGSVRQAAPVACWLAATSEVSLDTAATLARG